MCTGTELLIASMIMTGAGTGMQMKAQRGAEQERLDRERQARQLAIAEQLRQDELRRRNEGAVQENLQQSAPEAQQQQVETETGRMADLLKRLTQADYNVDTAQLSGQHFGGDIVKTDLATKMAAAANQTDQRLGAMARLGAFGNVGGFTQQRNTNIGNRLLTTGNFAQGGLNTAAGGGKLLLDEAAQIRPDANLMGLGKLFTTVGSGIGLYSAGMGLAGAGAAGAGAGANAGAGAGNAVSTGAWSGAGTDAGMSAWPYRNWLTS